MPSSRTAPTKSAPPASAAPTLCALDARRFLLGGAGLLDDPAEATRRSVRACIESLGFLQLDSICVMERAHHHILRSRLKNYQPALLELVHERDRHVFEHWTHDASYIPIRFYPFWLHRFRRTRARRRQRSQWWNERLGPNPQKLLRTVRSRLERDGPLRTGDLTEPGGGKSEPWWGWKPEKAAVEHLWRIGEVAVVGRKNFQKIYDLAHRVYPAVAESEVPSEEAYIDWACRLALEKLGAATTGEIAAFMHAVTPEEARMWCRARTKAGEVTPVQIESLDGNAPRAGVAFEDFRRRLDRLPDAPDIVRFLSPFDPALRDRKRALRLFGFDYRFEAFVPAAKRQFGYYVLPVLDGMDLIARMDVRLDRAAGTLEIPGFWWQRTPSAATRRRVRTALAALALDLGAETVHLTGADGDLLG